MSTQSIAFVPGGLTCLRTTGYVHTGDIDFSSTSTPPGKLSATNIATIMANGTIGAAQLAANAVGPASIANNSITSNQIATDVIQHFTGTFNAAQINNLGTGITVANAVVGQAYHVFGWSMGLTVQANNVAAANGANVCLFVNGVNTAGNIPATVITGNVNSAGTHAVAIAQTLLANTPLIIKTANGTSFDTAANCTARWDIWCALI